jgi:hypothetical protein
VANVLPDLQAQIAQLQAIVAKQQEQIEAAKVARNKISFRVNDGPTKIGEPGKRGLSILGMGQFAPTLYASQWLRILDHADELRAFIAANKSRLAWKE